jgi:translation initiation factor IF-3
VNHKIRAPKVRCVNANGDMLGVLVTRDALKMAHELGLDLVEVSPNADPPVCRIMDFGKFRYEESIKRKKARKQAHGHSRVVKEVKFHANVAEHDYQTKLNHTREFLGKGHKVKLSLQFRGRENAHRELGFEVMNRAIKDCAEMCNVEMAPRLMGRSLIAMLGVKAGKTVRPTA